MFSLDTASLIGIVTAGITEGLKWLPKVPLVAGQTAKIRAVAVVLAFVGNFGVAFSDGDFSAQKLAAGTIASFLVSFLVYKGVIKGTVAEAKPV